MENTFPSEILCAGYIETFEASIEYYTVLEVFLLLKV